MTRAIPLPDDVETLKAMLLEQAATLREREAQVVKLQERVDSQEAALASRAAEIEHLKLLIAKLRRMQFGRKSEKLDRQIEQLELRLEDLQADEGAAPIEVPKTARTAPEVPQRKPLPEHLPRDTRTYLPESAERCTQCGAAMKQLGEDVSGAARIRTGKLQGDPSRTAEIRMFMLRSHHAGSSAEPPNRTRLGGAWLARTRTRLQVR